MAKTKIDLMLEYAERTWHFDLSDEIENVLMDLYVEEPQIFTDDFIAVIQFLDVLMPGSTPKEFVEALKLHISFSEGC